MRSPGINGGELRGQPANPGSPGKMIVKMERDTRCQSIVYSSCVRPAPQKLPVTAVVFARLTFRKWYAQVCALCRCCAFSRL